jgi:hypothetical protein
LREIPTKEAINWHDLHSTLKVDPLHREWLNHQSCWSSNTLAYSTCIEFPSNAGIDGATLLAVQRWGRESEGAEWQDRGLVVHFVVIAVVVLRWLGVLIEERLAVLSDEISLLKEITQV